LKTLQQGDLVSSEPLTEPCEQGQAVLLIASRFPSLAGETSAALSDGDRTMHMSGESLLIILAVGLIAGWLAGQIARGTGFGIVGDLIIGIAGAFIGSWLLPQLDIHLGAGLLAAIINATIGALILLLIISLVRGGGGWGWGWGRRG